jgi:hypothetical protein
MENHSYHSLPPASPSLKFKNGSSLIFQPRLMEREGNTPPHPKQKAGGAPGLSARGLPRAPRGETRSQPTDAGSDGLSGRRLYKQPSGDPNVLLVQKSRCRLFLSKLVGCWGELDSFSTAEGSGLLCGSAHGEDGYVIGIVRSYGPLLHGVDDVCCRGGCGGEQGDPVDGGEGAVVQVQDSVAEADDHVSGVEPDLERVPSCVREQPHGQFPGGESLPGAVGSNKQGQAGPASENRMRPSPARSCPCGGGDRSGPCAFTHHVPQREPEAAVDFVPGRFRPGFPDRDLRVSGRGVATQGHPRGLRATGHAADREGPSLSSLPTLSFSC